VGERKTAAACGVNIYDYRNPSQHGFQISLFLRAGSMYESRSERGITHFLEHIAIRNVNGIMDGKLYSTLDKYGLELGASTYSEMVQFSVSGARENFDVAAELICKLLLPIVLPVSEIDAERARIKAEMRESGERSSLAAFTNSVVHKGTSLADSIAGSAESVGRITRAKLEAYRRAVFTKENVFFYLTGGIDDGDIKTLDRLLSQYELGDGERRLNIAPVPADFGKRAGGVFIKGGDYTVARFTFDLDMTRISVPEADLVYDLLLSGNNSRLFLELSERRGLCYDVAGNLERYSNIGTLCFYFELRESALYEATETVVRLLSEIVESPLTEDECMKAGYVSNARMLYDDARELNFTFAYDNHIMNLGYGDVTDRAEAYRNITPERLVCAAREIFRWDNLTLTVKGNTRKIDRARLSEIISALK